MSVIIPAYNAEQYVIEAIQSVLDQDYKPVEILLIDDGSQDETVDLVKYNAPQVKIIQQINAGAAAARNTGLRYANGELICFLDADDGWFPGKLTAQVNYLQQHPEVGLVSTDGSFGNLIKMERLTPICKNCLFRFQERSIPLALDGFIPNYCLIALSTPLQSWYAVP